MAKYEYNLLNDTDWGKLQIDLDKIANVITTKQFREYIADKCLKELEDIESYSLVNEEHSVWQEKILEYVRGHKVEYGNDYILIFNATNLNQDEMFWVSDKTRANYPNGISVAYIIEYGTGLKGTSQEDWQVNVNGYGANGWVYKDADGFIQHTTGLEGKFIYQKLLDIVVREIETWTFEYMERNEFL